MAFSKTPIGFFGTGYSFASGELRIPALSVADASIATFTTAFATNDNLTFAAYHKLKVGDKISLTTSGADLPDPLATGTDYFVKTASGPSATPHVITLSATKGGAVIELTDNGTGTHTAHALAPLQLLSDADGHATTGDWPAIVFALVELMFQKNDNTATADKPTSITISKNVRANASDPDTLISTYGIVIKSAIAYGDVVSE